MQYAYVTPLLEISSVILVAGQIKSKPYIWSMPTLPISSLVFLFFIYFLTLQYCIGFAILSTWIHHRYIHVPHPEPFSLFPPCTIPLCHPVHQPQASSIVHQTWTGNLFHIWYYTHSTLKTTLLNWSSPQYASAHWRQRLNLFFLLLFMAQVLPQSVRFINILRVD